MISLCFCYLCILCASHCSVNQPKPESVHLTALLNALQWLPCCPRDKVQTPQPGIQILRHVAPDNVSSPSLFPHPPYTDFLGMPCSVTSLCLCTCSLYPVRFMLMRISLHPLRPRGRERGATGLAQSSVSVSSCSLLRWTL